MEVLDGFDRQGKELSLPGEEDDEEEEEEEEEDDNEEEEEGPGLSYLQQELGVSLCVSWSGMTVVELAGEWSIPSFFFPGKDIVGQEIFQLSDFLCLSFDTMI